MEHNELRYGNWFEDTSNMYSTMSGYMHGQVYDEDDRAHFIDECVGILLTEEWLIKFGFQKGEHQFTLGTNPINQDYLIVIKKTILQSSGDYFYYQNGTFKIKYVHQLQNLFFSLTREELKAKELA